MPLPAGEQMPVEIASPFIVVVAVFIGAVILLLWLAAYGPQVEAWWRGRP